ncbi:hypothetical protein GF342_05085 [Candidatus Woesearchaeota archaeon]|nr:hypothetical protein [Candidatus Woesearchaeota archaeon]
MDIYQEVLRKKIRPRDRDKALRALYKSEAHITAQSKFWHALNYWLTLFAILIGNVFLGIVLVPLFVIADELTVIFFLVILGFAFGMFCDVIVYHMERVKDEYYALIAGLLPFLLLANFFVVTIGSNFWAAVLQRPAGIHNPLLVSLIYTVSFMLPFIYHLYKLYGEKKEEAIVEDA